MFFYCELSFHNLNPPSPLPSPRPRRTRAHSGGVAEEGGERRQGVLVLCSQRGEETGQRRAQREAEVCRHAPAGLGTPGEVGIL